MQTALAIGDIWIFYSITGTVCWNMAGKDDTLFSLSVSQTDWIGFLGLKALNTGRCLWEPGECNKTWQPQDIVNVIININTWLKRGREKKLDSDLFRTSFQMNWQSQSCHCFFSFFFQFTLLVSHKTSCLCEAPLTLLESISMNWCLLLKTQWFGEQPQTWNNMKYHKKKSPIFDSDHSEHWINHFKSFYNL